MAPGEGNVVVFLDLFDNDNPSQKTGEVTVRYDRADGRPSSVRLDLAVGLTPTTLQRFPWARYLTVADAARHGIEDRTDLGDVIRNAVGGGRMPKSEADRKRPGPIGRGDEFYLGIAKRYRELRAAGVVNPTATIADQEGYSRSAAAGWVRKARQRGYLGNSQPGMAGG